MVVLRNDPQYWEDKKLYGISPSEGSALYWSCVLNSSLCRLLMDLSCRQLTGAQAIADVDVSVVEQLLIPPPRLVNEAKLSSPYRALAKRPIMAHVSDEYASPDRRALDDVFFDVLGLNSEQRTDIYEAIMALVQQRLVKASSR